eukprot:7392024-Karenia_brevis.AAC.1
MSRKERSTVDAEILRLKGIKAKEIQEVLSGRRTIPYSKLSFRSRASWSRNVKKVITAEEEVEEQVGAARGLFEETKVQIVDNPDHAGFICTKCGDQTCAGRIGFDLQHLGAKVACRGCKSKLAAKEWNCSCGIRWYQCRHHMLAPRFVRKRKVTRKSRQHKAPSQSKNILESRLAELDGLRPQRRDQVRKVAQEARAMAYSAKLQRLVQKVCSKGNLKRKFGHLSEL